MNNSKASGRDRIEAASLFTTLTALIFSLYFMFQTGHEQHSLVLIGLFTCWVALPYAAILIVSGFLKRRNRVVPSGFRIFTILIFLLAVLLYSGCIPLVNKKPAFIFLAVPFFSLLLLTSAFLVAMRKSK